MKKLLLVAAIFSLVFSSADIANAQEKLALENTSSITKSIKDWVDILVPVIGGIGGVIALLKGVEEYKREQRWKRLEFVANVFKEFESKAEVKNVFWMLDWNGAYLNFEGIEGTVCADEPLLQKSFSKKTSFEKDEAAIRNAFDVFLTGLDQFNTYIKTGLIANEDFKPYLKYWLKILTNSSEIKNENRKSLLFYQNLWNNFIDKYEYSTRELLGRYGYPVNLSTDCHEEAKNQELN
ncbi:hypothetical protein [Gloeothece verrucosa]|uniref:Uncharacterized protein n=1 Tax=Gloeothece verrucosa (strain PCC 7822) TaxID=497965 RepID=E0ULL3_GLOV7|nr:hypothetical protein [Gloeothece verrucosa]ADN17843.1 hypothetical protein Cyan7822_5995 [Gloeothece verrucosa PCC 7822]